MAVSGNAVAFVPRAIPYDRALRWERLLSNVQRLADEDHQPRGIAGWLVLPPIGVVLTLALTVWNLLTSLSSPGAIALIFGSDLPGMSVVRIFIVASSLAALAIIGLGIVALVRFFRFSPQAPAAMIVYYLSLVVASAIDYFGVTFLAARYGPTSIHRPTCARRPSAGFGRSSSPPSGSPISCARSGCRTPS